MRRGGGLWWWARVIAGSNIWVERCFTNCTKSYLWKWCCLSVMFLRSCVFSSRLIMGLVALSRCAKVRALWWRAWKLNSDWSRSVIVRRLLIGWDCPWVPRAVYCFFARGHSVNFDYPRTFVRLLVFSVLSVCRRHCVRWVLYWNVFIVCFSF